VARVRRSFSRLLLLVAAGSLLSGCYRTAYRTDLPKSGIKYEKRLDYFAFGLIGDHEVDLDSICPFGVAEWRTEATLFNLWDVLTLGIYSPRTLVVRCAEKEK